MREYDLQEMKVEEMEEVNGGTSQTTVYQEGGFVDTLKNMINSIKDFFRGN